MLNGQKTRIGAVIVAAVGAVTGIGGVGGPSSVACAQTLGSEGVLVTVASGLNQPIGLMSVPGDDSRLFVIGKTGLIYTLGVSANAGAKTYTLRPQPAIDLTSVVYSFDNRGLTGMAFPPDYATSGKVYLFTNTQSLGGDQGAIVRYRRDPSNPEAFIPSSREVIFTALSGPYHHGGCVRFGPDGYLYLSKGDEGNIGILQCRNPGTFFGKILRFDVTRDDFPVDPVRNYGIPDDNPFAHAPGGLPEVWAQGLRSPWQFSFDRQTGDMWVGDVGENSWEEVTCLQAGSAPLADFGWPNFEGLVAGPFGTMGADPSRILFPAYAYPHQAQTGFDESRTGCSVNGGFVYRGSAFPTWRGRYFWSDFCASRIMSGVRGPDGRLTDVADMTDALTSPQGSVVPDAPAYLVAFGEDNEGELFVCDF
ncbi:MAG: PQQ-dependent sugar dehydrogenase, partial [Phycisphaerales bacterium]|nr:PQQ-dependent sugar dehydrogenase [Phycisphaerales bacterium]